MGFRCQGHMVIGEGNVLLVTRPSIRTSVTYVNMSLICQYADLDRYINHIKHMHLLHFAKKISMLYLHIMHVV